MLHPSPTCFRVQEVPLADTLSHTCPGYVEMWGAFVASRLNGVDLLRGNTGFFSPYLLQPYNARLVLHTVDFVNVLERGGDRIITSLLLYLCGCTRLFTAVDKYLPAALQSEHYIG